MSAPKGHGYDDKQMRPWPHSYGGTLPADLDGILSRIGMIWRASWRLRRRRGMGQGKPWRWPSAATGWVAPTVLRWIAVGPCDMAGGIYSVDCWAGFHGVAMGAGSDFINGNAPLAEDHLTRSKLGAGVWV